VTDAWDDLVATTLVGTDRRPFEVVLRPEVAAGSPNDPLDAAAALWAYRAVGRLPPATATAAPAPAAVDGRPLPPPGAIAALRCIVERSAYLRLLGEWLALAALAGMRLPPDIVPTVFAIAPAGLRPAVAPAAGPLGAWLAQRNPDWAWAAAAGGTATVGELERQWHEGADAVRLAALAGLREVGIERARHLATLSWSREPATIRLGILDGLRAHLGPDDEPLLERALDDRRKDVRRLALTLLPRLPDTTWARRMAARAVPRVVVEGRLRPRLRITYPTDVDASMARDGVEAPPKGWGQQQWWLRQLVAGTPLAAWTEARGRSPGQLVTLAAAAGDVSVALLEGWTAAAVGHNDVEWARALLAAGVTGRLLAVVPAGEADAVLIRHLTDRGLGPALALLPDRPASPALSAAVIDALGRAVAGSDLTGALRIRESLGQLALSLDPSVAGPAVALLSTALETANRAYWERAVSALLATLNFRHALHGEFAKGGTGGPPEPSVPPGYLGSEMEQANS
jgi:hypothetical protein